jgi:flagellar biogenesis protein FliO
MTDTSELRSYLLITPVMIIGVLTLVGFMVWIISKFLTKLMRVL